MSDVSSRLANLSPEQRALLERRLRGAPPNNRQDVHPLGRFPGTGGRVRRRLLRHLAPGGGADGPPAALVDGSDVGGARRGGGADPGAGRLRGGGLHRDPQPQQRLLPAPGELAEGRGRLHEHGGRPQHHGQPAVLPAQPYRAQPRRRHRLLVLPRGRPPRLPEPAGGGVRSCPGGRGQSDPLPRGHGGTVQAEHDGSRRTVQDL